MATENEIALYLKDDVALGDLAFRLESCGYLCMDGKTEIAKSGQVVSYCRRFSRKKRDLQIHVQITRTKESSHKPDHAYMVYAHTEPYVGRIFRHLFSAILERQDYAEGARLLCKDLGL